MPYRLLADLTVLVHALFLVFVILGGLLVLKWRWVAWIHLPAVIWGAVVEFTGWICPLTPLENRLRVRGGTGGYEGGFIDHYIMPVIYPEGLTRGFQIAFGTGVVLLNLAIYIWIFRRRRNRASG